MNVDSKIVNLGEEKAKQWFFMSVNKVCNDYGQLVEKETLNFISDRLFSESERNESTINDYNKAFRQLINNFTKYRVINVASIQTALFDAKK